MKTGTKKEIKKETKEKTSHTKTNTSSTKNTSSTFHPIPTPSPSPSIILDIENISKAFGGVHALDKCTFSVDQGSLTALIGPNGSGKTTMFNVISRLIQEDHGKIILQQSSVDKLADYSLARQGISRTFQQVRLFRNLTIRDHLEIALDQDDESLLKSIKYELQKIAHAILTRSSSRNLSSPNPSSPYIAPNTTHKKINKVLALVGLQKPLTTYVTDLSYGQRKLLDLAIAIAKPHTILLLDEPVAGINPQLRDQIKAILRNLHQQGETILLIEHDMNFVMGLAQKIYVMDHGTVIAQGTPLQIRTNPQVLQAYLGE